jgi:nitrate reductase delta subunit
MTAMWYALARLVEYPDARTHDDACAMLAAAHDTAGAAAARAFVDATAALPLTTLEEEYTAAFDFDPACTLDVGWHLFGESRERGGLLARLRADMQRAGIPESRELPDHLTQVLQLIAREPEDRAAPVAEMVKPAVSAIERALVKRGSPYAHVLAAIYEEMTALSDRAAAHR